MTGERERRLFNRIPMDHPVRLIHEDEQHEAVVLDVSFAGILVAFEPDAVPDAPAGTRWQLAWPLGDDAVIAMELELIHRHDSHMGFRCRRIELESMRQLRRLIELNLGDPELLEREFEQLGEPAGD